MMNLKALLKSLKKFRKRLEVKLFNICLDEIVPISELDEKDWTVEIKQAAGGVESTLFGEEVKNMYEKYAKLQGLRWTQVTYNIDPTLGKGCKYGRFEVMGLNSYKLFKHEIGVHKVQRVPETENKGRLHSSTCIVVVMPIIPKTFFIDPKDIRIETMRASGAGGQHINKTDSAWRATHIPTGIIATNQDERDQHANKDKALETLRERVYKYYAEIEMNKIKDERKQQMGTGDLSEKVILNLLCFRFGLTTGLTIESLITEQARKNMD